MAEMKLIQNGIKKTANGKRKRRKRNPSVVGAVKKVARKRNGTTKAGAISFAKKNGLKLVSRTAANGKRKRKRRNGITKVTRSRSNGLFGDTSSLVKKTLTLTGGAVVTNVGGNWLASLVGQYLAQFGLGAYTNLVTQTLVAMFGVPYIAKALKQDSDMARLGGMLSVTLTALNQFFPQFSSINPFTQGAIVVNPNGQVALTGDAVKQIAQAASQDTAAKIAGFANQMDAMNAGSGWVQQDYISNTNF
jgi:hypothetical protein